MYGAPEHDPHTTRRKPVYPISNSLREYLVKAGREMQLPVGYGDLGHFIESASLVDSEGNDTLWETLIYRREDKEQLDKKLLQIYVLLKTEGDFSIMEHLYVDRVDYCTFGNTRPYRIRIVNAMNDNQDYYYIKQADASRVYGLELEHLLSPNRMLYYTFQNTLVEEHVVGVPGDIFIKEWLNSSKLKAIRVAKELVKFNERSFIRLLGDMRPYNFVVAVTPDFEEAQVRIRAMDFDQQCYSGRMSFYRPQYIMENEPLRAFCKNLLNETTARQYQREEQSLLNRRYTVAQQQVHELIHYMKLDNLSTPEKVCQLRESLAGYYQNKVFNSCECMGDILEESLLTLSRNMKNAMANLTQPK